jgi:hypothetical protein
MIFAESSGHFQQVWAERVTAAPVYTSPGHEHYLVPRDFRWARIDTAVSDGAFAMSLSGIIRGNDWKPLGSPDHVKTQLSNAFPGVQFSLIHANEILRPREFNLTSLILRLFERQYPNPYWEGSFEGDKFAAVFVLSAEPVVKSVEVTLYGAEAVRADVHFAKLFERTGWQVKYPRF